MGAHASWRRATAATRFRLENGDYAGAIAEAELALETGAGHRFFSALALINKADAHLRLGQLGHAGRCTPVSGRTDSQARSPGYEA